MMLMPPRHREGIMKNEHLLEEIARRIDASARETREHVDASAKETREYVDRSIDASAKETRTYVDATAKETRDLFAALIENVEHPIRVIAEGHAILVDKVDSLAGRMDRVEDSVDLLHAEVVALRTEMRAGDAALREEIRAGDAALREEMRAGDAALHEELAAFRAEVRGEFAEVRRVARLESAVSDLAVRVGRLEGHAAT